MSVTGWWEESALRRALENLTLNAARYGDGRQVSLNVRETHGLPYVQAGTTFTIDIPVDGRPFRDPPQ